MAAGRAGGEGAVVEDCRLRDCTAVGTWKMIIIGVALPDLTAAELRGGTENGELRPPSAGCCDSLSPAPTRPPDNFLPSFSVVLRLLENSSYPIIFMRGRITPAQVNIWAEILGFRKRLSEHAALAACLELDV